MTNRAPLIVAIVLLVLPPLLYVGSYLALVKPQGDIVWRKSRPFYCHYRVGSERVVPNLFWPLEQLDRKLRPTEWIGPAGKDD
ncbi:hypothetical protein ETAA8_65350 [Anatilimnocola aggregata]|uniref:Uncharacterized protein n=1 Tax=Anatilimnocola aggregata TaxID=2528021 RepID=A0A517YMB9_9BACT|nr:hypothetical protein [Anatilimnocola aggregata]QDU31378.1 hypothetical protein ETAA8_65350 [Anatilimnocola aggregata]